MFSITDGNPRKLYISKTISSKILDELAAKKLDARDSFWAYHELIFEDMPYPNKPLSEIWKKLTKAQKTILAMGHFISQTNNGGVWQFQFNRPEYAFAALEAMHEVSPMSAISMHYERVLKEFVEMLNSGRYDEICAVWNDQSNSFEEQWNAFQSGKKDLPSLGDMEEYFFDEENNNYLYQKLCKYIDRNLGKLVTVEAAQTKNATKKLKKKEAIPHFTAYIKDVFGVEPIEVSVYYTGRVTLNRQATQLFLMKFKLPDGYESIGITGDFTYHLPEVDLAEINQMYKKYHKQELVNLYHGYHLLQATLEQNPKANEVDPAKWAKVLKRLQGKSKSQVPVNVTFQHYLKYQNEDWYFYTGDLLYNDKKVAFPNDLTQVPIVSVREKGEHPYRGEANMLFKTQDIKGQDFGFGRCSATEPVKSKHIVADLLGRKNKLLKDNPWGF